MENDDAYANAAHIPGGADYPERWEDAARAWREVEVSLGRARLNQAYGPDERNRFDLFYPSGRPNGLIVFIHGGYWRSFGREMFSHLARGATQAGWAMALPGYRLAPRATIPSITRQIAAAVTAAAGQVPGPLIVTGHSAGGHLAARMLCPDVALAVRDRLLRCVPVSPVANLTPLLATTMNADLRLDAATALAESPVRCPDPEVETIIWVGGAERPAFLDQARRLAAAWPRARLRVEPDRHHLDVIEGFEKADSPLMTALLDGCLPSA